MREIREIINSEIGVGNCRVNLIHDYQDIPKTEKHIVLSQSELCVFI